MSSEMNSSKHGNRRESLSPANTTNEGSTPIPTALVGTGRSSANPDILMGRSADQALTLDRSLWEMGIRAALESGEVAINSERKASLVAQARARALAQVPEAFSPETNPYDKLRLDAHQRALCRCEQAEQGILWARKRQFEEEEALATLSQPGPSPRVPIFGLTCAVGLFAISLTPTLQAVFAGAGTTSGYQSWILPGVLACMAGLALSIPQVRSARVPDAPWWERHAFLVAGLIAALGLAVFRFRLSTSAESLAIGWALVGLDVAAVLIAEALSALLRREWLGWQKRHETYACQLAKVEAAKREVATHQEELDKLRTEMGAFVQELHDRESMHRAGPALVEECVRTVEDGYTAGIQHNRGLSLRGTAGAGSSPRRS